MHKDCSVFFSSLSLIPVLRFSRYYSGLLDRIGNERSFRRLIDVRCGLVDVGLCAISAGNDRINKRFRVAQRTGYECLRGTRNSSGWIRNVRFSIRNGCRLFRVCLSIEKIRFSLYYTS